MQQDEAQPLTPAEEEDVELRSPPRAKVVHAAVVKQGEDELDRPMASLFWSGLAAGIAMLFSVTTQAALHHGLPDAPWRESVAALGYTLGFLIVILGRMQLFTEHTVVAILPLARDPSRRNWGRVARLWLIVFAGNLVGVAAAAALAAFTRIQPAPLLGSMLEVSAKLLDKTPAEMLLQGIPAGFLIAAVAWIRSAADDSSFWIIIGLTYPIALGGFTHVVAGAVEAFLLLFSGSAGASWLVFGFLLPVLIGNVIGGTGLFAMLAHAQVKEEL